MRSSDKFEIRGSGKNRNQIKGDFPHEIEYAVFLPQMLKLIPRAGFQQAVAERHKAESALPGVHLLGAVSVHVIFAIWDGRSRCARRSAVTGWRQVKES